tara:strand:- start:2097 stop:2882 length:786 start_codon:yes stop_codon:yes gene_type:complete
MKIISIDVGIKNLAYCLIEYIKNDYTILNWDVINLCDDPNIKCMQHLKKKPCCKKATFYKLENYYCNTCAKKYKFFIPVTTYLKTQKKISYKKLQDIVKEANISFMKDSSKDELLKLISDNCLTPIQNKSANDINLIELGKSIKKNIDLIPELYTVDKVLIENQVSPIANRMKTLQGMIAQYYIMKNITDIEFISASNKLKSFVSNKTTYAERKKISVEITKNILKEKDLLDKLEYFNNHKKNDDLADAFLQVLWYISNFK